MRWVSLATLAVAVSTLVPNNLLGQSNIQSVSLDSIDLTKLSISGYQLLSEVPFSRGQSYFTYRASLTNTGPALPEITATVTTQPSTGMSVVSGMGNLHFPPTTTNATVQSLNSFTILANRTAQLTLNLLNWSYNAPAANIGPNQSGLAVGTTVTLNGSGSTNPNGIGTLTYSWVFSSVPTGSAATISNPTSVTPTFVPDLEGDYVLTLTVSNGVGRDTASVIASVTMSGTPPPVGNAGPNQMVNVGAPVHLGGSNSTDFNNKPLTYSWTLIQKPAGSNATLTGANTVSPTFVADVPTAWTSAYLVQLVVNDSVNNSSPSIVTITTNPLFPPPVANAGQPQTVALGATVQLNGSASTDSNDSPLTYSWSLITLPGSFRGHPKDSVRSVPVQLSNPSVVNPSFPPDAVGSYVAQLIVNDGVQNSTAATMMITVNPAQSQAPAAQAGSNQTVQFDATGATPVMLSGSGTDPQGLTLTYHWMLAGPPGSAALLNNPSIAKATFVPDKVGLYTATLTVSNGTLSGNPSSVQITVNDAQPVANPGPPQSVVVGSTVTLNGSASSDSDHAALTYSWSLLTLPQGSNAVLNGANTVSPNFIADVAGMYVAQLIVNDGVQKSTPQTVAITAAASTSLTLSPNPLNLTNLPGALMITLGSPAGSNGQVIALSVTDPTVVTVPQTVTILPGALSAPATITPLKVGSVNVTVSTSGFRSYLETINVTEPAITLTLNSNTVGVGNSVTGTISLSSAAPSSGVTVALSLSQNGFVSLSTPTVSITGGATFGTFTVQGGPSNGSPTTITASASGYTSSSQNVTSVIAGGITLPTATTAVALGQTTTFPVSVGPTAASSNVTITLISSDPTKVTVTPSIVIPAGSTSPTNPAQITGVNLGSVTITASATGYVATSSGLVNVAAGLAITTKTLPAGTLNAPYTATVATTGGMGPYTFAATNLPAGLTINSNSGVISGTPTGPAGTSTANLTVKDSTNPQLSAFASLSISIAPPPLAITTASPLTSGAVGVAYTATVAATGGTTPYTWSATGLAAGLTINASSGVISGTPTGPTGTSTANVTVKDSATPQQIANASLSITIRATLTISTTSPLTSGIVNTAYTATVVAAGGPTPYTWSATSLPAGLTINASTGAITGSPTGPAGTSTANVTVKDSSNPQQTATAGLSITIVTQLAVTTTSLPAGVMNTVYTATVAATGGATPYTWSATGLPAGLTINASTGAITGSPTGPAGTGAAAVTVKDSSNPQLSASANLSITIASQLGITTASPLSVGILNTAYTATVAATGGTTPYTWSATGLPAGLTINASTGAISGLPTGPAGTGAANVTVKDSSNPQLRASANLSIAIVSPLGMSTASPLSPGVLNTPYTATVAATGGTTPYTWSATGLPAGLTINASTGAISGSPTGPAGTSAAIVTVKDSSNPQLSASANLSITIASQLAITTASPLSPGVLNTAYTATVAAMGGTAPYTWSASGLPGGLTINAGTGAITGTPTGSGTSTVNVTVKDSGNPQQTTTASLLVTIVTQLAITTTSLPAGVMNTAYTAPVVAAGGAMPYTWSASGLPAGLTINASTGAISGSPTGPTGTSTAAVTVKDSSSPQHTATASLSITLVTQPAITTTSLPAGVLNTPYTATVAATGGTTSYTWSATGLPAGLTINASTGAITGAPTGPAGTSTVNVSVKDSTSPQLSASANLSIIVVSQLGITTASPLSPGILNTPYTATVAATGGTTSYTWSATGLPAGLTINASTGAIIGSPTGPAGTTAANLTVKDSSSPQQTANASLSITLVSQLTITTTSPLAGSVMNTAYTATVLAAGGTPPYTWSAPNLPSGLTINASTGVISGTPAGSGTSAVNVTVKDSGSPQQTASASLSITISPQLTFVTASPLTNGVLNAAYSVSMAGTGGAMPYTWSATNLPGGLSINASTGAISGAPTGSAGTSTANVTVKDSGSPQQTASANFSITIISKLAMTTTSPLTAGVLNTAYTATVAAAGGTMPYTWSATNLPAGLTINAGAGAISGTPTATGTSTVIVTVKDSGSPQQTASASFSITIASPPLTITTTSLPGGAETVLYGAAVTATGGTTPYTWSTTGLPTGLAIDSNAGVISGAPVQGTAGSYTVTVTLRDSGSPQQITFANFLIPIVPAPTIMIAGGTVGQNLQIPIVVTLSQPATGTPVSVSSNNPAITLSLRSLNAGTSSVIVPSSPNTPLSSIVVYAQATASTGAAIVTATSSGYKSGAATVTAAPSGFVLSGPNGVGGSFTSGQGQVSPLMVAAAQLDSSDNFVQVQQLAGGQSVTVPISIANSNAGTVSPTSVTFAGGTSSVSASFTAGTAVASSTIMATEPAGFNTPTAGGNVLPVSVTNLALSCATVQVGQHLENTTSCSLNGAAPTALTLTLTSDDPTKLLFAPCLLNGGPCVNGQGSIDPTAPGVASITMTIRAGTSSTSQFYVYGVGNSGTATYSANASGISGVGSVILTNSGFVLAGAGGLGQDFFATVGAGPQPVAVQTAMLDASGNYLDTLLLAGGQSASVAVTSSAPGVGTISGSPVTITAGNNSSNVQFTAVTGGTTTLAVVTPAGYTAAAEFATENVAVGQPGLRIISGNNAVGNNLELVSSVVLLGGATIPASGLPVTLTASGALLLSATGNDAGSSTLTITIPSGQTSGTFYIYGQAVAGTATVTATAAGFKPDTATEALAPSGVIIAGPNGPAIPFNMPLSSGNRPLTVSTAMLDTNGNLVQTMPLAGTTALIVSLSDSKSAVGAIPSTVTIMPGPAAIGVAMPIFQPIATGTTVIGVTAPGFSAPTDGSGSLTIIVQ